MTSRPGKDKISSLPIGAIHHLHFTPPRPRRGGVFRASTSPQPTNRRTTRRRMGNNAEQSPAAGPALLAHSSRAPADAPFVQIPPRVPPSNRRRMGNNAERFPAAGPTKKTPCLPGVPSGCLTRARLRTFPPRSFPPQLPPNQNPNPIHPRPPTLFPCIPWFPSSCLSDFASASRPFAVEPKSPSTSRLREPAFSPA